MKKIFCLVALLFLLPSILAINLDIEKISDNEAMILGLDDPAVFKLNVTNNGPTDSFTFYTFFGLGLEPKESVRIKTGETQEVTLSVYPREDLTNKGFTVFSYFIQDSYSNEIEEKLTVHIVELEDAFEIGAENVNPESRSLEVYIHNKVNFNFEDLDVRFSSPFFDIKKDFSLGPNERENFKVDLNKQDFDSLMAGFYTLNAEVEIEELTAEIESKIKFEEKSLLDTETKNYGFIIVTKVVKITNNGNMIGETDVNFKRSIFTRLFTTVKPEPTNVERDGTTVHYSWNEEVSPGETYEVSFKTNWLLPFLAILLIVLIVVLAKKYSKTDLAIRKKVTFVNAKGGEFALKVTILVEAKEYVEKIRIIDKLPPLVRVYGRFGGEIPARFHKTNKVFEWDFAELEAGERRVLSYIIYSKVGVLGKFALPATRGVFQKDGLFKEVSSNKAYFLAQQQGKIDLE